MELCDQGKYSIVFAPTKAVKNKPISAASTTSRPNDLIDVIVQRISYQIWRFCALYDKSMSFFAEVLHTLKFIFRRGATWNLTFVDRQGSLNKVS